MVFYETDYSVYTHTKNRLLNQEYIQAFNKHKAVHELYTYLTYVSISCYAFVHDKEIMQYGCRIESSTSILESEAISKAKEYAIEKHM